MVCVYCASATKVTNSRPQQRSNSIWRRRQCLQCGAIFTTEEHLDLSNSLMVAGHDGSLTPFKRDLLFLSLYESCKHQPQALTKTTSLTTQIISKLVAHQLQSAIVTRDALVQLCQQVLDDFDSTAAAFYQAYHPLPAH